MQVNFSKIGDYYEAKNKDLIFKPEDYDKSLFEELKNIGGIFSDKDYQFTFLEPIKKRAMEVIDFYSGENHTMTASQRNLRDSIIKELNGQDLYIFRRDNNLIVLNYNFVIGTSVEVASKISETFKLEHSMTKNKIRIYFKLPNL